MHQARPMARKPFVVNDAIREKVRHLAGLGVPQDDIARIVQCSPKTLRKRCRDDLDCGAAEANAIVSGCLFAAAKGGNITAQIFWLKSRARWRERDASDHRAADGDAEANSRVVLVLPDNGRDSDLVGVAIRGPVVGRVAFPPTSPRLQPENLCCDIAALGSGK